MTLSKPILIYPVILALILSVLLTGCGSDDSAGLSDSDRSEVREMVRAELAAAAPPGAGLTLEQVEQLVRAILADTPGPGTGLTSEDVEDAVQQAIADLPAPESGLASADVEDIVGKALANLPGPGPALTAADVEEAIREALQAMAKPAPELTDAEIRDIALDAVALIPLRSMPADYTKFVVDNAIRRYDTEGLDATLSYYNQVESVDGQWYVFIIDENDKVIGHYDAHLIGEDLKGPLGTDANGYNFGPEMLSATDEGKWVSYVHRNPKQGDLGYGFRQLELKNVWVVRRDNLLFASGWYIDADEFTRRLVSVAVDTFREGGLAGAVEYFARPDSALAGLESAIAYYNSADTVSGEWFAFIADGTGKIATHSKVELVGKDLEDILGTAPVEATKDGSWLETGTLRVWLVGRQGWIFGSGWQGETGS